MIRFKLKEAISKKEFILGRRITLKEIAETTGINRMTLTKINTKQGYSTSTDTLDKLCNYLDCGIDDLVEHISDKEYEEMKGKNE